MAAIKAKVSEKGCVSVTGLQRFPVSLYVSQWQTLAKAMPALLKFIEANKDNEFIKAAAARKAEGKVGDGSSGDLL